MLKRSFNRWAILLKCCQRGKCIEAVLVTELLGKREKQLQGNCSSCSELFLQLTCTSESNGIFHFKKKRRKKEKEPSHLVSSSPFYLFIYLFLIFLATKSESNFHKPICSGFICYDSLDLNFFIKIWSLKSIEKHTCIGEDLRYNIPAP